MAQYRMGQAMLIVPAQAADVGCQVTGQGSRRPYPPPLEDGLRRCYELPNQPWHGRVIWVESPFMAVAAADALTAPALSDPGFRRARRWTG
jgi:hypothetical protein